MTKESPKKLLLHACCAPCSSSVLERLSEEFSVTIYYFNPNLDSLLEYEMRSSELEKLSKLNLKNTFDIKIEEYLPELYDKAVKGYENLGEGSLRCYHCYELRMRAAALFAKQHGYDLFTTTLSVSPYKKHQWIQEIGQKLSKEFNIEYYDGDFKKKDGYKRSTELSKALNLYRQNYCGCKYSKQEAALRSNHS